MCFVLFAICDNASEKKLLLKWFCLELGSWVLLQRASDCVSGVCMCVVEG